ncbi:MAG: hypothetical protein Q7S52_04850 [bacterium]|nr:hypothetical protein [bacterium]
MISILKKPSAWIPIALSLAMLAFLVTLLSMHGIPTSDENKDEGVAAHLFQLWLVLEAVMIPYFAVRWLAQAPKDASLVLALQIALVLLAAAPVFYLQL